MKYFIEGESKTIVNAVGFVPKNAVPLPANLENEKAEWLEVDRSKGNQPQVVVNQTLKENLQTAQNKQKLKSSLREQEESLLRFLRETDWVVIREQETGKKAPADVLTERQSARAKIDKIRQDIEEV